VTFVPFVVGSDELDEPEAGWIRNSPIVNSGTPDNKNSPDLLTKNWRSGRLPKARPACRGTRPRTSRGIAVATHGRGDVGNRTRTTRAWRRPRSRRRLLLHPTQLPSVASGPCPKTRCNQPMAGVRLLLDRAFRSTATRSFTMRVAYLGTRRPLPRAWRSNVVVASRKPDGDAYRGSPEACYPSRLFQKHYSKSQSLLAWVSRLFFC